VLTYQVEPWSQALPEMMGLFAAHWDECAADKDKIGLDLDLDQYAEMERQGKLHLITARKNGQLVGYYVWIVGTLRHYRTVLAGLGDLYWLRKDCRKWFGGIRLFLVSEKHLKSLGVKKLFSVSTSRGPVDRLFIRLGWMKTETVYCKWIGQE
jgi:hypothetical protein